MSRATIVFLTLVVSLFCISSSAARLVPALPEAAASTASSATQKGVVEDSCEGIGNDECLERRTLVAHLDYIYTNDKKP
ncbi:hypothetical protein QVD17_10064 [Tagetes erecta]|uniref:Phytosulfokine n=1 Tax=Tagetes erecta TaxID=13708 RepID=A0AAD8P4H2_TARER|nr:hypothetical protein QVD17_10064 [Tagetes erecta]